MTDTTQYPLWNEEVRLWEKTKAVNKNPYLRITLIHKIRVGEEGQAYEVLQK